MINNVVLAGRLTRDPELKYTTTGTATATFTLAVTRDFNNANGEKESDFINCVVWRKTAETLANYAKKGSLIDVIGRIQTRSYENQQGQKVYVTEVVVEKFHFLEKRDSGQTQRTTNNTQTSQNSANQTSDPFGGSSIELNNDDLPF